MRRRRQVLAQNGELFFSSVPLREIDQDLRLQARMNVLRQIEGAWRPSFMVATNAEQRVRLDLIPATIDST